VAHLKTEWWLTFTGQTAQPAPDYSQLKKQKYQLEQMIRNIEDSIHDKTTY
jgi:hypothetical protein